MIELQGALAPVKETDTGLDGLKLGDLREEVRSPCIPQGGEALSFAVRQGDQYWLVVGNQRLAGKVEKLADPLAVFHKEVLIAARNSISRPMEFQGTTHR